ncbi:patatin-like phospholipase family protein [Kribbella sp. NPDC050820]|uniref:patatin-like phospholipase family protein n=1 Tax=Kribbella sp. NPDC050820 TaxID=3155408 RepID=UPI0033ECE7CD
MEDMAAQWPVDSPALGTRLSLEPCGRGRREAAAPAPSPHPLACTFSGGGFRATFAALGVARLLADLSRLGDLRYASSVSGGSVANGILAAAWPAIRDRGYSTSAVDELVIDPAVRIVSSKSLKISLVKGLWRTVGPRNRTDLLARRFDEWFFGGLRLTQLDPEVRWIVNAANLTTGVRFRFERDVFGDYTIGLLPTVGTNLRLSVAVAASAAVPGAFAPIVLKGHAFPCGQDPPVLVDGGAYDNTGLQALDRDKYRDVFLVSLNAGGLLRPGGYGRIPLIRELARANSLLYRQSTGLRTRMMVERFSLARTVPAGDALPAGARRGVLVALATDFPAAATDELRAWRAAYPEHRAYEGRDLSLVPTVFDKLAERLCRTLVYRGWWLTGAALAMHWPERLPDAFESLEPPQL